VKKVEEARTVGLGDDIASALLDGVEPGPERPSSEIAECVADEHPVFTGRARCRFQREGAEESWLPCLFGVRPRPGDRVLVMRPSGEPHGLVVGVVDGFRRRVEADPRAAHVRRIGADEVIRIEREDGAPMIELRASDKGATVRLLSKDVSLAAEGSLEIAAESVSIAARAGGVRVKAADDVEIAGEHIHLN